MIVSTTIKPGIASISMATSGALTFPVGMSIDDYSQVNVVATAVNLTFSIPTPTLIANYGHVMFVCNTGANPFVMYNQLVPVNSTARFQWTGAAWLPENVKHPAFAVAPTLTFTAFTTPTVAPVPLTFVSSTEKELTYRWTGTATIPNTGAWRYYIPSAVAGYTAEVETKGMYRTTTRTGYPPAPLMEKQCMDMYGGSTTTYTYNTALPGAIQTLSNLTIYVRYTRN